MSSRAEAQEPAQTGHPAGLYVLFGAEMWERFSYYGMRALLVLYLTNHLRMARKDALDIYAIYTGLVYLTPLIGGYLADKVLGQRKAILIGGIVMAMGHFAMAFEPLLELALGLLILGNGFFKPNISTMVGQLYPQGDPRRDGAYTIFYMGINLGAFFSPLVCGTLGEKIGWHYGFGAAGVGMVFGLISFLAFQRFLVGGFPPGREAAGEGRLKLVDWVHVVLFALGCLAFAYGGIRAWPALRPYWTPVESIHRVAPGLGDFGLLLYRLLVGVCLAGAVVLLTHLLRHRKPGPSAAPVGSTGADLDAEAGPEKVDPVAPFTAVEWQRIAVILIVAVFSIVFWMGFEQAGGTLTLFADKKTDRVVPGPLTPLLGREFPASYFQSVNPFLIFVLAPLFSMLWTTLDRTRFKINSVAKMGIGLLLLGLGFVVMAAADRATGASVNARVGAQWLAAVYFLHTLAELCLSPIGLSLVNKLAPARVASLMMAVWFLSTAIANYLAGKLEALVEGRYNLWQFLIVTSIVPGVVLLAITPVLKKLGHGRI